MSNKNNYLKRFIAKATSSDKETDFNILHWKSFERGYLLVNTDKLQFGEWEISYDKIDNATLYKLSIAFIPYNILCVKVKTKTYKFAINPNHFWNGKLPFSVDIVDLRKRKHISRRIFDYIAFAGLLLGIYKLISSCF